MEALTQETVRDLSLTIQAFAILVVAIGVARALVGTLRLVLGGRASDAEMRTVWLGFAHWLFFFSSRRRHTRCLSDWSSDVCSSDLGAHRPVPRPGDTPGRTRAPGEAWAAI